MMAKENYSDPNGKLLNSITTFEVNGEEVKLSGNIIRDYLVSGNAEVTDQEIIMFLQLCKYQKLNPFLN
ncbi:TPA: phage recombination protein Bet, partial [Listeria monocytogenes]|nr:phage recombination protein Bet [Listeria monocytogenes]